MSIKNLLKVFIPSLAVLTLPFMAMSSDIGSPSVEVLKGLDGYITE